VGQGSDDAVQDPPPVSVEDSAAMMRTVGRTILRAADRLEPARFTAATELIRDCEGKVVTTGTGTSGIIARKIAATLTSTGTAAFFLHPSDALHGALGIVTADDVVVLVSNSGETDELLVLVPYLKHRKVPMIAIVGNEASTLANCSDVVLDAFAEQELGPLHLAPTASTSVALVVGDVLAMAVSAAKHVTPEGFALNHPSGRLGKRLTLRVDDLLVKGTGGAEVVRADAGWHELIHRISAAGLGAVVVEDDDGRLIGIITDGDVRRTVERGAAEAPAGLAAADVMTRSPVSVLGGSLAYDALQLMERRPTQISALPVVDAANRYVGILRLHDLVRSGI
jgi:arabinose-5-phosphate isomerase